MNEPSPATAISPLRQRLIDDMKPQTTQRECLDESLLQPLAGWLRCRIPLPTISKHMPQLMPKLVGQATPVPLSNIGNKPGSLCWSSMQPDRRWSGRTILHINAVWLPIRS
jgi:hypothetical protein